jgi:hypothetical protein
VFFAVVVFLPPVAGFVLGMRLAFLWLWLGVLFAAFFEAIQIRTEGTVGTLAAGGDWSNFWAQVAVYAAVAFYVLFAVGVAFRAMLSRPGGAQE